MKFEEREEKKKKKKKKKHPKSRKDARMGHPSTQLRTSLQVANLQQRDKRGRICMRKVDFVIQSIGLS